jgi:hypothetical protein
MVDKAPVINAHPVGGHGVHWGAGPASQTRVVARSGGPAGPVGVVFGAIGVAVLAMLVLHLRGAGRLDPLTTTVSDYVSLPGGAVLLTVAVVAIAVATATTAIGLLRAGLPAPAAPSVSFGLGCAGLLAAAAFPTNPIGTVTSLDTVLHRYAAGLFFVCLPVAALLTLRRVPDPATRLLTTASVVASLLFLASHLPLVFPGFPDAHVVGALLPRGLAERTALAVDLTLLASLARVPRLVRS